MTLSLDHKNWGHFGSYSYDKMMDFTTDFEFVQNSAEDFYFNKDVQNSFDSNGFIIVRNLFSAKEIELVKNFVETDENIEKHAYGRYDGNNKIKHIKRKIRLFSSVTNRLSIILYQAPSTLILIFIVFVVFV